jgi:hypothetical protein
MTGLVDHSEICGDKLAKFTELHARCQACDNFGD